MSFAAQPKSTVRTARTWWWHPSPSDVAPQAESATWWWHPSPDPVVGRD
ncbi:hypothetical protein [Agilicoccus flavus]|nr:hypothetical protein [Agilicoccus flavus]